MKIKKSSNLVIIEAQKAKAVFPLDVNKYKPDEEHDLVLSTQSNIIKPAGKSILIENPGEYEAKDIFVYALANGQERVKLFSVDIDGVNLIIFNSSDQILELLDSDDISENNILVCNVVDGDIKGVSDIIDELEPNIFILTGKNETILAESLKKLSLTPTDTQTYYTFSEEDFGEDNEKPMQVVLLK